MCASCSECVNHIFLLQHGHGCSVQVFNLAETVRLVYRPPLLIQLNQHHIVLTTLHTPACRKCVLFGDLLCLILFWSFKFCWFCEQKFLATHRSSCFAQNFNSKFLGATSYHSPSPVLHSIHFWIKFCMKQAVSLHLWCATNCSHFVLVAEQTPLQRQCVIIC